MQNPRKRVPPRDKALRSRYFGLLGRARKAPPHQRQHLLQLARGLMVWVEAEPRGRP
jgi:hypothetical protein